MVDIGDGANAEITGVFGDANILNPVGEIVTMPELKGISVGLLFCNSSAPSCLSTVPFLIQFYNSVNTGGLMKKIEIIYVSCDTTPDVYEKSIHKMPWLHMEYNDAVQASLKKRYDVMDGGVEYVSAKCMEIPSIVVIDNRGGEIQRFPLYHGREASNKMLNKWDWRNNVLI